MDDDKASLIFRRTQKKEAVLIHATTHDLDMDAFECEREAKLKEASDEALLCEVRRRHIDIMKTLTEAAVEAKYAFGRKLGEGNAAAVYEVIQRDTRVHYAMKRLVKAKHGLCDSETLMAELNCLKKLRHQNIVNLHELFETTERLWIIMELVKGGELRDYIAGLDTYSEDFAAHIIGELLRAVIYIHRHGTMHRDIKMENLLLSEKSMHGDIKLADFGLAGTLPMTLKDREPFRLYAGCHDEWYGTAGFMAPEVMDGKYGGQCDIYSVGCVLFQLLTGTPLYPDPENVDLVERQAHNPAWLEKRFKLEAWRDVSEDAKTFCKLLLRQDPKDRPLADEAYAHPWVSSRRGTAKSMHRAHSGLRKMKPSTSPTRVKGKVTGRVTGKQAQWFRSSPRGSQSSERTPKPASQKTSSRAKSPANSGSGTRASKRLRETATVSVGTEAPAALDMRRLNPKRHTAHRNNTDVTEAVHEARRSPRGNAPQGMDLGVGAGRRTRSNCR